MQPKREPLSTPPPENIHLHRLPQSSVDTNNWRTNEGVELKPNVDSSDWRDQVKPELRQRIIDKIVETLKKCLPVSNQEGLNELRKIGQRFEEKIFIAAFSQSDYLRKISIKMLTVERAPGTMASYVPPYQVGPTNNPPDPDKSSSLSASLKRKRDVEGGTSQQVPGVVTHDRKSTASLFVQNVSANVTTSNRDYLLEMARKDLEALQKRLDDLGDAEQEIKDLRSENERLKMAKSTDDKGLKLQVKGLEFEVEKLKTHNASLQEEVVNLKKTNIDLEAAIMNEAKAAGDFAAGFAEAIAQVQVLAPAVDISKKIQDGQLVIISGKDEGGGGDSIKKLVDVQDDQIHI